MSSASTGACEKYACRGLYMRTSHTRTCASDNAGCSAHTRTRTPHRHFCDRHVTQPVIQSRCRPRGPLQLVAPVLCICMKSIKQGHS